MSEHEHNWQPASTTALYRCAGCRVFGYKANARTGFGGNGMTVVQCRRKGCKAFAVQLHRVVKGRLVRDPRCMHHKDGGAFADEVSHGC